MITLVYPYRNRDLTRIKNSLESLNSQTNNDFTVLFIDYGSKLEIAQQIERLVHNYKFATYHYCYNIHQPWNKSKVLNFALNLTNTPYFFVADVDIIFHPDFINISLEVLKTKPNVYFKVSFLSQQESLKQKAFEDYEIKFRSTHEATGLSLFKVKDLKAINGFDENYHFWGAEDTDVHVRLKNAKKEVYFYQQQLLLLHQWHKNYINSEQRTLTTSLQVTGIVQRNHEYLKQVELTNKIKANEFEIGQLIDEKTYNRIDLYNDPIIITNKKSIFENWFYNILCKKSITNNIHVIFKEDDFFVSRTFLLKKILKKRTPHYIPLKEINDMVLSYITSNLHTYNYVYKISEDLKSITLKILVCN